MAQLGLYTTTEAVRACLGIDVSDCSDAVMVDSQLDAELEVDLGGWLPTHSAIHTAGAASDATAEERLNSTLLSLYAQWFCAAELADRFMLVPQIYSDGKNQMNRYAKVDLERMAGKAKERRARYRSELDEAVNAAPTALSTATVVAISSPDYDPVTGV